MTEEQKSNEQPKQEEPQESNQDHQEGEEEKNLEEEAQQEKPEKVESEALNANNKEEDLFAGPYERLIDRKFIPDPNYPDTKILRKENFIIKY